MELSGPGAPSQSCVSTVRDVNVIEDALDVLLSSQLSPNISFTFYCGLEIYMVL